MFLIKEEKDFSEREITTFKQLFGFQDNSGPDFAQLFSGNNRASLGRVGTFREGDSEHNDAMLN